MDLNEEEKRLKAERRRVEREKSLSCIVRQYLNASRMVGCGYDPATILRDAAMSAGMTDDDFLAEVRKEQEAVTQVD